LALHPNNEIVASGQVAGLAKKEGKPHIRIWNVTSLQTLKVVGLGSFQRGICCVAFSVEDGGAHVVGVDDGNDHNLSVWEWENKKKVAEAKGGNEPVLAVDFHPSDSKRLVTCGKSHIAFWKLNGEKKIEKKMGVFEKHAKPKYVLCFAFGQNGEVISGDSNGNIFIWANEGNQISQEITAVHEGPIFSIESSADGMFLSGGGKDRKVFLWDSNYNKSEKQLEIPEESGTVRSAIWGPNVAEERSVLVGTTKNCILQGTFEEDNKQFHYLTKGHSEETWGLCVHPSKPLFVTCGYDKMLCLWNSEDKSLVWAKQLEDQLQSVCIHPNGNLLAVATQNNKFQVLDADTGEEFYSCEVGSEQHDCIKYSPDGCYLAVGSHDNFIYLFTVSEDGKQYKKHGRLSGHSSYITHLDWSKDSQHLQSNSGDYEILYWQAKDCKQVSSGYSMRDTEWDTWSCVLGFPVRGIWPEGADGTDINTCIRSHSAQYLVNGDDSGALNIFTYPCTKLKSTPNVGRGHSSHVTAVGFLATDSHVVSTGGKDNTVMQWKLES
ncbi:echinoderm microtubule-associated -like 2 isoform X3, partial [Paramuricea clavata]